MLKVYTPNISTRNRYIIKTVLKVFLKIDSFELTSDLETYLSYEGPRLTYDKKKHKEEAWIYSSGFLNKKDIQELELDYSEGEQFPKLFSHQLKDLFGFDLFAASFYLISRYEEYLPHIRDHYDRFTAKQSISYSKYFLKRPIVDEWALALKAKLLAIYPDLNFGDRQYQYIHTIDIDNAFAYKHKGLVRTFGSLAKTAVSLNLKKLKNQLLVLMGQAKDPFDTYDYQKTIKEKFNLNMIYFFLLADYGLNDKNLPHENQSFRRLIMSLADEGKIGIHPSFGSNQDREVLVKEIKRLREIAKREVVRSRQHFLKLSLPETYRNLIQSDILEDYTMGYASESGFRAACCTPFPFYDLDEEAETKLIIFPFQVMESTFQYYQEKSKAETIEEINTIINSVKAVNGTFISLWHNESLSDEDEWKGWRSVYESMIEAATESHGQSL